MSGFGIAPDVVLGRRGGVSHVTGSPPHHVALGHPVRQTRLDAQGGSDVGQRPQSHQGEFAGSGAERFDDGRDGVSLGRGTRRSGVVHSPQPIRAVEELSVLGLAHQGLLHALVHRRIRAAQLDGVAGVDAALLQRHVAIDDADACDVYVLPAQGHQNGDSVVRRGVRVDPKAAFSLFVVCHGSPIRYVFVKFSECPP